MYKRQGLSAKYHFRDIIHNSAAMDGLIRKCQRIAKSDSSVMIYGETGTGKELLAQSIHNASQRADGPFLAINCAAIPENLLEDVYKRQVHHRRGGRHCQFDESVENTVYA